MRCQPNLKRRNREANINDLNQRIRLRDVELRKPDPTTRPYKRPIRSVLIASHLEEIARDLNSSNSKSVDDRRICINPNKVMLMQIRRCHGNPFARQIGLRGADRQRNVPDVLGHEIKLLRAIHAHCDVRLAIQQVTADVRGNQLNRDVRFLFADMRDDVGQVELRRHHARRDPDSPFNSGGLAQKRSKLGQFKDVSVPSYKLTGYDLAEAISDVAGQKVDAKKMAWWPLRIAGLVCPIGRALVEMRYLWGKPHYIDPSRHAELCSEVPQTPLHDALAQALSFYIDPNEVMRTSRQAIAAE